MTPERYRRLLQALQYRQPDLTVITDEVHKGRNISAIVRTCDAVGIDTIHCVVPGSGYRGYRGTASGSHKWVNVELHSQLDGAIQTAKAQSMQVVAAALSEHSCSYLDIDYTKPTAILVGAEKFGISEAGLASANVHVSVPMVGLVESLNVSVAVAIILQEVLRQRMQVGMYGANQLPAEVQKLRFFQWAHPKVAAYCDERNLDYPEINPDDGEIIDPSEWYRRVRESGIDQKG
ncbi:tRNA (guanosine(18)-2'-O)-methyltransferase TrmH [Halioxenophilus sp. WMMB6]|uniref:tRNA (guanosine(18)-2'-O)-methyltransferase TrmH n=1 Tax=Halioxenophilus sp. WMMB6 TaxID=3073815 RepID=UPI00295EB563|nr:tRNA (guanosine(18)-2'-O)-methyltransferase TrmH [Halioxenophilus sp. WMMB6]